MWPFSKTSDLLPMPLQATVQLPIWSSMMLIKLPHFLHSGSLFEAERCWPGSSQSWWRASAECSTFVYRHLFQAYPMQSVFGGDARRFTLVPLETHFMWLSWCASLELICDWIWLQLDCVSIELIVRFSKYSRGGCVVLLFVFLKHVLDLVQWSSVQY
jgi:hypothetical protein